MKTDDSDSSNDGDDDKYVVYGYAKNEKTGSGNEDSESDSKDHENDKECMNFLEKEPMRLEKIRWKNEVGKLRLLFSRFSKEV